MMFYMDDVNAGKIMTRKYTALPLDAKLSLAVRIFIKNGIDEIYLLNKDKKLVGVIRRDKVWELVSKNSPGLPGNGLIAVDIMDARFKWIGEDVNISDCIKIMEQFALESIPVVKEGTIIGVVRYADIIRYLLEQYEKGAVVFDGLLNDIQEAVCIIDSGGRVIFWNNKAEQLYDIPKDVIIGNRLDEFFPDAIDLKVLRTKEVLKDIFHSPRKGSNVIISASPIMMDGRCVGVISTDKDISDIRRINGELEKVRERADFLEGEIGRLTGKWDNIFSKNKKMQDAIEIARRAAASKAPILITGESGTGKEVFARAIHSHSGLKGPFVPVNCSAIPAELFESEFFGYESGAFTGASKNGKAGYFELANKGTLFLDEIGDMPLFMQSKLLRAAEDMKIRRVGGERSIDVDVRIISATNRNLEEYVKNGAFREDLYYRLNVIRLALPPLRERKEDIITFLKMFLAETCKSEGRDRVDIDKDAVRILTKYAWKGNIRELKNVAENMVILCIRDTITAEDIPEYILNAVDSGEDADAGEADLKESVCRYERGLIVRTLRESGGNIAKAAKRLGIPRSTLHYKIGLYDIDMSVF